MKTAAPILDQLRYVVRQRNRELSLDAALKIGMGFVFSLLTFGFLFWLGLFVGFGVAGYFGLHAWQFAAIFTGIFFVAAVWSAWQRVNPLAGVKPMTDRELMLTLLSQASGQILYFSPRRATVGAALIILGGPVNVVEGIGIWAHRLPGDPALIEQAAQLLESCQVPFPFKQVRSPAAAYLLKRLALIKVVPHGESSALTVTQKGSTIVG